jgi:hypothetical protein
MYICEINVTFLVGSCVLLFHKKIYMSKFFHSHIEHTGFSIMYKTLYKKKQLPFVLLREVEIF